MAHFVRLIPFDVSTKKDNSIWISPDFTLKLKRGTILDHAILMACLFMGCNEKELRQEDKKEDDE